MAHPSDVSNAAREASADADPSPTDAFREAAGHLREIKAYTLYYVAAKMDAVRSSVRRLVVYAVLGLVAAVIGLTALVVAVVLTMEGLASLINWGLSFAYPGLAPWIGPLIVGVGVMAILTIGVLFVVPRQFRMWRQKMVKKYDHKRREQRVKTGHDVRERAAR
jgi:hypothetical protein